MISESVDGYQVTCVRCSRELYRVGDIGIWGYSDTPVEKNSVLLGYCPLCKDEMKIEIANDMRPIRGLDGGG